MSMALLEARNLYRFFHAAGSETVALRDVSLSLERGETVCVVGPSGSGKSTLLNCLSGLDDPDGGAVSINRVLMSRQPEAWRTKLRAEWFGILLQGGNLVAHLTVAENIQLAVSLSRRSHEARVADTLRSVGLEGRDAAYPEQLSGGEGARAALAAALAADPPILIADEPTAEVDQETELGLIARFEQRRLTGKATLIATHSAAVARRADRVIVLRDGQIHG